MSLRSLVRKIAAPIFLITLLFVVSATVVVFSADEVTIENQKIIYELPYTGLLPDHPLYPLKAVRDRMMEFLIRDPMKKAEHYLLLADKRAGMALALSDKGKDKLAATTYSKAEKYLEKIPALVAISKSRGESPTEGFSEKLNKSVIKHAEVGETLLKELPQGQASFLRDSLELNAKIQKEVQKL